MHEAAHLKGKLSQGGGLERPGSGWWDCPGGSRAAPGALGSSAGTDAPLRCGGPPAPGGRGCTLSSYFTDDLPSAVLPQTEPSYQKKVLELVSPGLFRAPKMRSFRKRWTSCRISLLLIFLRQKKKQELRARGKYNSWNNSGYNKKSSH